MEIVKIYRKLTIIDPKGLHMRPTTAIVKFLCQSNSTIYFMYQGSRVNAKSILSVLSLAAITNTILEIDAEGDDAEEVIERLLVQFPDVFKEANADV